MISDVLYYKLNKKMKKWLKLGITAIAAFWLLILSLITLNSTEAWTTAPLKLVLSPAWVSSCTLTWEWSWTANASTSSQTATNVKNILTGVCTLNQSAIEKVTLPSTNLVGSAWTITIDNVSTVNTCTAWSTLNWTCWAMSTTQLTTTWVVLYTKSVNKIWTLTVKETLSLSIPAWTAPWTYTWEASIMVQ